MGRLGGGFRGRSKSAAAGAAALALAACASGPPPTLYDLTAANPPSARALRAQIRIGQPTATADLDSDHILVREFADARHARGRGLAGAAARAFSRASRPELRRTRGSDARSTAPPRTRTMRSISISAPSSSTPRRKKRMSTSPPGSSRSGADGSRRTRSSRFARRSLQPRPPDVAAALDRGGFDRHDPDRQVRRQGVVSAVASCSGRGGAACGERVGCITTH